jgi:hypothetical protein
MEITLKDRKYQLLGQIAKLKREVEVLNWSEPEYKEIGLRRFTGTVKYSGINRMYEYLMN